ncbi:hypothetical protein LIBAT_10995 [Leptospira interrogans]
MMWELSQITILGTNSKIVGTHTFRKFFLTPNSRSSRITDRNFCRNYYKFFIRIDLQKFRAISLEAQSILDRIEELKKADFCGLVSWVDSEIGM